MNVNILWGLIFIVVHDQKKLGTMMFYIKVVPNIFCYIYNMYILPELETDILLH